MDIEQGKRWAKLAVGAVIIAGGTYWYASSALTQPVARIAGTGCAFDTAAGGVALPLALVRSSAGATQVSIGPIAGTGMSGPISLRFDPSIDTSIREVSQANGEISLPSAFGRSATVPDRITLTCRDSVITQVRFQEGRSSATFAVVQQVAELQPAIVAEEPPAVVVEEQPAAVEN